MVKVVWLLLWSFCYKSFLVAGLGDLGDLTDLANSGGVAETGSVGSEDGGLGGVADGLGIGGTDHKPDGVVDGGETDGDVLGAIGGVIAGGSGGDGDGILSAIVNDEDEGTFLPRLADADALLEQKIPTKNDPAFLGAMVNIDDKHYDAGDMNPTCYGEECTVYNKPNLLDIGIGIISGTKITYPKGREKFKIIQPFPPKPYKSKNIFGNGVPKPQDETATCKDYARCKKLRIFPAYNKLDSPYLYRTPYYKADSNEAVVKTVITTNSFAPGQPSKPHIDDNDDTYLREFQENLMQHCPLFDTCGSCNSQNLVDQTTVFTLDEIPCDIFYTALRLYDANKDKQEALAYNGHLISLDEPAGVHWFKLATDLRIGEQLVDTNRLQFLYYLLVVTFSNPDENAFFILKQNYTSLCTPERERCRSITCPNNLYYTFDGTCNNAENSLLGRNPTSLLRIGQPYCTLESTHDCKLPSARTVSLKLGYVSNFLSYPKQPYYNIDKDQYPSFLSLFGLFYVQFALHDIVQFKTRGVFATQRGGKKGCSRNMRHLPQELVDSDVATIDISPYDPFYSKFNATCMEFVKAQKYNGECAITNANLGNFATSFLDLSQLYAENECGMKDYIAPGGKIKPAFGKFPTVGDQRAFQTPLLLVITVLHGILHNIIAELVKNYQNSLTDYEIFQISRLCNIYIYQYFLDNHVFPAILGKEYSNFQGITSPASCYDVTLDPTPLTEFSCAATRYLHVFLPNKFDLLHHDFTLKSTEELSNLYGGPSLAFTDTKAVFLGMIYHPVNVKGYAFQVQNSMFKFNNSFGADLISFDVQRGRDCCTQPYIFYIKKFFGVDIKYWEDLSYYIPVESILQLKQIYSDVCQLELYAGISVEKKYEDGLFGPVARKIVTEQVLHTRCGDSKHYTNALDPVSKSCFSKIKYNELFAYLVGVTDVQEDILMSVSKKNRPLKISDKDSILEGVTCLIQAVIQQIKS